MVKEHIFNLELSKEMYQMHKSKIAKKECYSNIFNVLKYRGKYRDLFMENKIKVAYGYYLIHENLMARHCFIINDKNEAIDPTVLTLDDENYFKEIILKKSKYISYIIYDSDTYFDAIIKNDMYPSLDRLHRKYEKTVWDWATKNNLVLIG